MARRGPGTERGKAVVRLNPVRHGVLSTTPVLPLVERGEDWERLRGGLLEYWEPSGAMEELLVGELAMIFWRRYRCLRFESESILVNLRDVPRDWWLGRQLRGEAEDEEVTPEAVAEMDAMLALRLLPGEEALAKVMRYETMLHRELLDLTQQLLTLKALRSPGGGWRLVDVDVRAKRKRNYVSGRFARGGEPGGEGGATR